MTAEQNKGRMALAMGVIMMVLGAGALIVSLTRTETSHETAQAVTSTTLAFTPGPVRPADDRADELERQLAAYKEKLAAAEKRLDIERESRTNIREELSKLNMDKQDLEAKLQSVAAERALEKKTVAAIQAALDKANAGLAKLQEESAAAAAAAKEELAKAQAIAQEQLAQAARGAEASLAAAKAEAEAEIKKVKAEAAQAVAQAQADIERLTAEIKELKARQQAAPVTAPIDGVEERNK